MNRLIRLVVVASPQARACWQRRPPTHRSCARHVTLPNPMIVTGSSAFEATLEAARGQAGRDPQFPSTIIYVSATGQTASCAGVANAAGAVDLGGLAGRYYTLNGTTVTNNNCTFVAGQKPHVGISDVYYEGCANVTQPKPADIVDVAGPAQAMLFIVPKTNTAPVPHLQGSPDDVRVRRFQRTDDRGILRSARHLLPRPGFRDADHRREEHRPSPRRSLIAPQCVPGSGTANVIAGVMGFPTASQAIGFIAADAFDANRTLVQLARFSGRGPDAGVPVGFRARCQRPQERARRALHDLGLRALHREDDGRRDEPAGDGLHRVRQRNEDELELRLRRARRRRGRDSAVRDEGQALVGWRLAQPLHPRRLVQLRIRGGLTKSTPASCMACTGTVRAPARRRRPATTASASKGPTTMRNHLLKLSFAVLLGGALLGSACSSSNGTPTGSAGHGGSTAGTAGTSGTRGHRRAPAATDGRHAAAVSREPRRRGRGRRWLLAAAARAAGRRAAAGGPVRRDDGATVPRHADQQDDDRWRRRHAHGADGQLPGLPVVDGRVVAARRKASPAKARQAVSVVGWSGTVGLMAGGGAAGGTSPAAAKKEAAPAGPVEAGKPWPPVDEAAAAAAKAEAAARAEREAAEARERAETRAEISALRSGLETERAARIAAEQALSSRVETIEHEGSRGAAFGLEPSHRAGTDRLRAIRSHGPAVVDRPAQPVRRAAEPADVHDPARAAACDRRAVVGRGRARVRRQHRRTGRRPVCSPPKRP